MQRQRVELVPVAEALADLPGPVQALIPSPPTQRHFTRADQVNQLASASEADPDLGFMARMMVLCSLPRTNPGNRHQYKRVNGPYKALLHDSTAARVGALFQLLVQDTTAQDFGLPSSAIRLRM